MNKMIFIFLDGVGIGDNSKLNPFFIANGQYLPFYQGINKLADGTVVKKIDPLLNIPGIPQSASGQTTIFTGENIPAILNTHKGSYPDQFMRKIIKRKNLLQILKNSNVRVKFLNAYPVFSKFFTARHIKILDDGRFFFSEKFPDIFKRKISTTTCMMISCDLSPYNEKDIIAKRSIYQDFTNSALIEKGLKISEFSPETAADIIFSNSRSNDFILYEYFQTDIYGHRRSFHDCVYLIKQLDRLLKKLISLLNNKYDTLLLTSDHGNLEDYSTKSHTKNQVPLVIWGKQKKKLREEINNIADITPAIINFFNQQK